MHNEYRQQLEEFFGIRICHDWWNACATSVQQQELILEQLLHHDLRNVVEARDAIQQSVLQHAVTQSLQQGVSHLPESFRLLLQVENFTDMGKNLEQRLDEHSTSSSRCLQLAVTDGHDTYTAMEVTHIPTTILPGAKVLLRGKMTIRNGVCGWTPNNIMVLGGYVTELVEFRKELLRTERQRLGHGVDPTVKALIWMNNIHEEQQNGMLCVVFPFIMSHTIL